MSWGLWGLATESLRHRENEGWGESALHRCRDARPCVNGKQNYPLLGKQKRTFVGKKRWEDFKK